MTYFADESVFVDTGINLDLPAGASQKPRLPKRSQILALIRTHVAQRTEGQEYPGERAEPGADRHIGFPRLDKETRQRFESLIPRGKMGRPEEIATAALFLASDDSSYLNGVELSVDGGFSAI
jgi:NAD(P)-dependent dehydrogenase (short-subunit alcohol dehydrogenase family)